MSAEKEIVNYWLNRNGFFTISNLKSSRNKNIDALAIKFKGDKLSKVWHVEVSCFITSSIIETQDVKKDISGFIDKKFNDKNVVETIKKKIIEEMGEEKEYENVLIISSMPSQKKDEIVDEFKRKGVIILEFNDILCEVISTIDTHYYKDSTLRALQLVKYLLLASPNKLANLFEGKGTNILRLQKREKFLKSLLQQEETKRSLKGASTEKELISLLKSSSLSKPEKLANIIVNEVLSERSKRRFLMSLLKEESIENILRKSLTEKVDKEPIEEDKSQQILKNFLN